MTITAAPETITDLEFDLEIPCEGRGHPIGTKAHIIDQKAAYAFISPCCHSRVLLCRSRGLYLKQQADTIHCPDCGRDSSAGKWRIREI